MFKHIVLVTGVLSTLLVACSAPKKTSKASADLDAIVHKKIDSINKAEAAAKFVNINEVYQPSYTITHDIVHTALAVKFDWKNQWMYGKEALTLHTHFYATDTIALDAKGLTILKAGVLSGHDTLPVKFVYTDSLKMHIKLDRVYTDKENFTLVFSYISKPNERKAGGSNAITSAKGLYFINPLNLDPHKPRQVWTQGETESNSAWMITIDKPNMKSTHEIAMTVEKEFTTLSNGLLISQKDNGDGTRTDIWKMDKPIAPYLFMMAAGTFTITHDKWHDMEVNYYTDPEYAADAKAIFGHTPEMIEYYSRLLNYPYPWQKYSQIVAHDYVSGAMENATATLHGTFVQMHKRAMIDGDQEEVICHELFHHWFGDLVTCESWSNLTVNESFANYSEDLWLGYKYGQDEGDYINDRDMKNYFQATQSSDPDLVRFTYKDKEEMFDAVSYNKGGRILNMLRHTIGDSAFFKGLSVYLHQNAFKAAEAHQLRLAMEQVSGQDLNWFFNQWYFNKSYPILKINYLYKDSLHLYGVVLKQTPANKDVSTIWKMPMVVDIYSNNAVQHNNITMIHPTDTFWFYSSTRPDLMNVDAQKMLLCRKTDNKTIDEYIYQYHHALLYKDRLEAVEEAINKQSYNDKSKKLVLDAMHDKFWRLREKAINGLDLDAVASKSDVQNTLVNLAQQDTRSNVRAAALNKLNKLQDSTLLPVFTSALNDSSYAVLAAGLSGIYNLNKAKGLALAKTLQDGDGTRLQMAVSQIFIESGDSTVSDYFIKQLNSGDASKQFNLFNLGYGGYLSKLPAKTQKQGVEALFGVIKSSETWWIKLLSMNAIESGQSSLKSKLVSLTNAGNNQPAISDLNATIDNLSKQISEIKQSEKDTNLLKYWK